MHAETELWIVTAASVIDKEEAENTILQWCEKQEM